MNDGMNEGLSQLTGRAEIGICGLRELVQIAYRDRLHLVLARTNPSPCCGLGVDHIRFSQNSLPQNVLWAQVPVTQDRWETAREFRCRVVSHRNWSRTFTVACRYPPFFVSTGSRRQAFTLAAPAPTWVRPSPVLQGCFEKPRPSR